MPLYEYRCAACDLVFEELVSLNSPQVGCPRCKATEVARQLSSFASPSGTSGPLCADGCGEGSCAMPMGDRPAGCCGGACHGH